MTQEIFDYLWIRTILCASNKDKIIESIENNRINYGELIKEMAKIMQREDLVLISDEISDDFDKVIQKYRFDNLKNKEVNDDTNYIITRFQSYKLMSPNRRKRLMDEFFKNENVDRGFPIFGQLPDNQLLILVASDFDTFIDYFTDIRNQEKEVKVYEPIKYISLLNLLLSRFPDFYKEENLIEPVINNINVLIDTNKLTLPMLNYCKKTLKRFKKFKKEKELEKRLEI